jgi:hypothetical protein
MTAELLNDVIFYFYENFLDILFMSMGLIFD